MHGSHSTSPQEVQNPGGSNRGASRPLPASLGRLFPHREASASASSPAAPLSPASALLRCHCSTFCADAPSVPCACPDRPQHCGPLRLDLANCSIGLAPPTSKMVCRVSPDCRYNLVLFHPLRSDFATNHSRCLMCGAPTPAAHRSATPQE